MRQYIKKIMVMLVIIVCILSAGNLVYKEYIRIQNIFDQMFYTRIRTHYDWWEGTLGGGGNYKTSFSKMSQIEPVSRDNESFNTEMGHFVNSYKDQNLREGESLVAICDRDAKTVKIIAVKRFNEFDIVLRYVYDINTKRLQEGVECEYGELSSGKNNGYPESFKETSKNLQEILLVIEESGLTKDDLLEYKKYFLYDKLLTDWLAVNESRFSIDNWGNVEFIEVLPFEEHE